MITVNLLPEEKRPVERTPLPRLFSLILGVVLISLEIVLLVWLVVLVVPEKEREKERLRRDLAVAKKEAEKVAELEAKIKEIEDREKTILGLYERRILWAPKLDAIADVIPDNVWLTEFSMARTRGAARARRGAVTSAGKVTLKGLARGTDDKAMQAITRFMDRLKENELLMEDFEPPELPGWKRKEISKGGRGRSRGAGEVDLTLPKLATEFELTLMLKPPAQPKTKPATPVR